MSHARAMVRHGGWQKDAPLNLNKKRRADPVGVMMNACIYNCMIRHESAKYMRNEKRAGAVRVIMRELVKRILTTQEPHTGESYSLPVNTLVLKIRA